MPMSISKAQGLSEILVIEPRVFSDKRGYFYELFNEKELNAEIGKKFVQDNVSYSEKGALRGMHYQLNPKSQGKLVQVLRGSVYDACIDIRKGSPTFGKSFGCVLSDENHKMLYVPPGFAHGFVVLEGPAVFVYKCTEFYAPELERSILWRDPALGIRWPEVPNADLMSDKDKKAPLLVDAENNFVFESSAVPAGR